MSRKIITKKQSAKTKPQLVKDEQKDNNKKAVCKTKSGMGSAHEAVCKTKQAACKAESRLLKTTQPPARQKQKISQNCCNFQKNVL